MSMTPTTRAKGHPAMADDVRNLVASHARLVEACREAISAIEQQPMPWPVLVMAGESLREALAQLEDQ